MHKMLLGGKTPKDGASVVRAGFKAVGHREQPLEAAGVPISCSLPIAVVAFVTA